MWAEGQPLHEFRRWLALGQPALSRVRRFALNREHINKEKFFKWKNQRKSGSLSSVRVTAPLPWCRSAVLSRCPEDNQVPGLMHVNLGGYHVRDIEFSAAFDVIEGKVCHDLSEAIFAFPNNTFKFAEVPHLNVPVSRGMTHDGLGKYLSQIVHKAPGPTADIVGILKEQD
jgi:hypothetical protein